MAIGRRWGIRAAALSVVLAVVATTPAARAEAPEDLDAAEAAYANLDYDMANTLSRSLAGRRGLTHAQLVRTYRILGRSEAVLGRAEKAYDAFVKLLAYAPDETLDAAQSPKIRGVFVQAQGFWAGYTSRPGMDTSTSPLRTKSPGEVRVELVDPMHLAKAIVVYQRWNGTGSFASESVAPRDTVRVPIPVTPAQATRLEYYVQALDDRQDVIFESGDAAGPKVAMVEVPPPQPVSAARGKPSILSSPVFWIVGGAVLAGAGATIVYFATRKPTEVTDPPTGVTLSPTLLCKGTADGRCQ